MEGPKTPRGAAPFGGHYRGNGPFSGGFRNRQQMPKRTKSLALMKKNNIKNLKKMLRFLVQTKEAVICYWKLLQETLPGELSCFIE